MKPYRCTRRPSAHYCAALIFLLVTLTAFASASKQTPAGTPSAGPFYAKLSNDARTRVAFEHFYNMEYDRAIHEFELVVQAHPDDPFAINHLTSGILWKELYRIGALDSELYAKDAFLTSQQFPPDPKVQAHIKELINRAQALEDKRLQANPNDVDALYARGATKAIRGTYMALIEKSWLGALRNALSARRDHERVLQLDPNYQDAKFVVGVHQYVVGSLNWAWKVAVAMIGVGGNKAKGIQYLYEAANAGGETSVDAKIALSLFLRREQRYQEAINLVGGLMHQYPRNYLVALEHANLLNAAGHGPEAVAAYRRLLELGNANFPDARLEQAAWGMGEALRGQRDFKGAAEAYEMVSKYKHVEPDLQERSNLAAGEMYDVLQDREMALKKYREVLASGGGQSPYADIARRHLKKPYRMPA
jgi:tetratricopeptide (TPR) repeat protein